NAIAGRFAGRHHLPLRVDGHAVAGVVDALAVHAHAVHAHYVALVLDGAGDQQLGPRVAPRLRPAGHVERGIVIAAVAGEHGEAQVEADLQEDAPTAPLHHHAVLPGAVMVRLVREAEQVPLVVVRYAAVRPDEEAAVEGLAALGDDHAAVD